MAAMLHVQQVVLRGVVVLCGVAILATTEAKENYATCFEPKVTPSLSFSVFSTRNVSGHWVAEVVMDEGSEDPRRNGGWLVQVDRSTVDHRGLRQVVQIKATTTTASAVLSRHGYEFFPGIGYYKFHTLGKSWQDARQVCAEEGGHLVVLNSEMESEVLQELFARFPDLGGPQVAAFVGFHDKVVEGQYVTIDDEPLATTGFTRWSTINPQPDNAGPGPGEDCGSVHRNGGLNDYNCDVIAPFFCEKEIRFTFPSFTDKEITTEQKQHVESKSVEVKEETTETEIKELVVKNEENEKVGEKIKDVKEEVKITDSDVKLEKDIDVKQDVNVETDKIKNEKINKDVNGEGVEGETHISEEKKDNSIQDIVEKDDTEREEVKIPEETTKESAKNDGITIVVGQSVTDKEEPKIEGTKDKIENEGVMTDSITEGSTTEVTSTVVEEENTSIKGVAKVGSGSTKGETQFVGATNEMVSTEVSTSETEVGRDKTVTEQVTVVTDSVTVEGAGVPEKDQTNEDDGKVLEQVDVTTAVTIVDYEDYVKGEVDEDSDATIKGNKQVITEHGKGCTTAKGNVAETCELWTETDNISFEDEDEPMPVDVDIDVRMGRDDSKDKEEDSGFSLDTEVQ